MEMNDDHYRRAQFLRPLSMTCKAMRLRFLPWIWDLIEPSRVRGDYPVLSANVLANFTIIADAARVDTSLATSVKYLCVLLCPWAVADSCPPKVHDRASLVRRQPSCVHHRVGQLPRVPPKSPHTRDGAGWCLVVCAAPPHAGA